MEGLGGGVILALADSSPRRRSGLGLGLPLPRPNVPTMSRPILLARWFWFVHVALALVTNAWGSRYVFSASSLMEVGPAAGGRGELRIPVEAVVGEPRYGAGGGLDCFWRFASPMTVDVCELVAPICKEKSRNGLLFFRISSCVCVCNFLLWSTQRASGGRGNENWPTHRTRLRVQQ